MSTLNLKNLREEICNTLRSGDILSVAIRGVTTTTDNFTATAGQTTLSLTHTGVKNIRSLTVNTVAKMLFKDFTVAWATGVVTMLSALTLSDVVVVNYDYSSTADRIYPDYPRDDLSLSSYPRVAIELTSMTTEPFGLGGMVHISDILLTVYAIVPADKDLAVASGYGGLKNLTTLCYNIRDNLRTNAKSLYICPYITPSTIGPIVPGTSDKLMQSSQDFRVRFRTE